MCHVASPVIPRTSMAPSLDVQAGHHSESKKARRARGAALPFPLSPGGERVRVRGRLASTVVVACNSTLRQRMRFLSRSASDEESRSSALPQPVPPAPGGSQTRPLPQAARPPGTGLTEAVGSCVSPTPISGSTAASAAAVASVALRCRQGRRRPASRCWLVNRVPCDKL